MKRILIVDDQADIRELILMTLEMGAFDLHEAGDGVSGLAKAIALTPDLILLDRMMPGELDGVAVCERIRADARLKHIPIIMLTGMDRDEERSAGLLAGADDYLSKPFSPRELLELVERMTGA